MSTPSETSREYRVILLPATRRDGEAIESVLAKQKIACQVCLTAASAASALTDLAGALVLTDDVLVGLQPFLISEALLNQASWSDIPVVFLSKVGSESRAMLDMVSRMSNVTLLDRPTSTRTLLSAIQAALRSRGRQYQMRDQLASLQHAEAALRESDQRKDEFLAMLAHELRNPMAAIRTAADLLPRLIPGEDARARTTVDIVRRQTKQLVRLVDDLLDVSRINQGRVEMQLSTVDLNTVVNLAIESVEPLVKEKHHLLKASMSPQTFVFGDSARLVQCVSNLLTNAVKYTPSGGSIQIDLSRVESAATLSVSDNGIGISADLLPRIFDLFVQDERALDRSQGGLGIGLSVVRQLIEMQGGTVTAESAGTGAGATFRIVLPTVPIPETAPMKDIPLRSASLRILVVDDNEDAANALAMLLSINGHSVKVTYDGQGALTTAASFKPDLILLDIGLPVINGYEVATRLRASGDCSRLVALTGYGQHSDVDRALNAGFHAHIVKPVEPRQLEELLMGITGQHA